MEKLATTCGSEARANPPLHIPAAPHIQWRRDSKTV
jgi:hypothetical protein